MFLLRLLLVNNVIDKYLKWTFGDGHLVIVGDCFDRGRPVMECLWLIYSLEDKARKAGGFVHFILGNNEIMNMNGDWRYVHPKYAYSSDIPYTALYAGSTELWRWLSKKNIVEKIGDILFVHAGISFEILKSNLTISEINEAVRPFYNKANYEFHDPLLNTVFDSDNSPFWFRGYYQGDCPAIEDLIAETLNYFNVRTIITGHTVVDQITSMFGGKVINVDTNHAAGRSEALMIKRNRFYRVQVNGTRERIK